jgi:hypothetical protein
MRVSPAPENTVTEGKVMTATNLKISPLPGRIKSPEELLHEAMSERLKIFRFTAVFGRV